ncbi:ArsC/Spx/MgsR family protein [Loigolactobacillus rennini]|uniref:Uncharacterized protein n=2 Tax=Loigolactobacillus rennini TaxID=238013 RepID=A0A0R2CTU1_9LACO|nr:ArsC/Spx/MgsR family protein [Loigolactobacillus rennini]KRM93044.1 hypothetical protein FC24_GL000582 [Loigolactobacillus rennini DSM 20253]
MLCAEPRLLRRPIIVDAHKVQIGFNDDEIRQFVPRHIRRLEFMRTLANAAEF